MDKKVLNIKTQTFTPSVRSDSGNLLAKRSYPDYFGDNVDKSSACDHETKNVKRHCNNSVPFHQDSPKAQQANDICKVNYNHTNYFPFSRHRINSPDCLNFHYHLPPPFHHLRTLALDKFMARSHLVEVKERPSNLINGSRWDNLSLEIWNKFFATQQSENVYKQKILIWKNLYTTIKNLYPRYSLYLGGSTITGYGTNNSDMDLCLLVKTLPLDSRYQVISHLINVEQIIRRSGMFGNIEMIRAKVPILKFRDVKNNIEIDLNCNNLVGIRNTHLLHCYSEMDWRVRPLVLIIKLWAKSNRINDPKNKSISSYSLVLMVIHYLQYGVSPPVLPCLHKDKPDKFNSSIDIHQIDVCEEIPKYFTSSNTATLGELLCGFYKYYCDFQYDKYAISVRTAQVINIADCKAVDSREWKFLCIEEPFDLSNTARSVYDFVVFSRIREVFRKTSAALINSQPLSKVMPVY